MHWTSPCHTQHNNNICSSDGCHDMLQLTCNLFVNLHVTVQSDRQAADISFYRCYSCCRFQPAQCTIFNITQRFTFHHRVIHTSSQSDSHFTTQRFTFHHRVIHILLMGMSDSHFITEWFTFHHRVIHILSMSTWWLVHGLLLSTFTNSCCSKNTSVQTLSCLEMIQQRPRESRKILPSYNYATLATW